MESSISKSEKKRQAKIIEQLAKELVELSVNVIKQLPCDAILQEEIISAKTQKAGAKKRQIKFIAKELRHSSPDELLSFLEKHKGSKLKKAGEFHELERIRDSIITEVLNDSKEARSIDERLTEKWQSSEIGAAKEKFPDLDAHAVKKSALRYAATRKPTHGREIFRLLKAASERLQFQTRNQNRDK